MNDDHAEVVFNILAQLFACYPNTVVEPQTTAMYVRILSASGIAPDELQTVVDQAVATCKFLPTIAELLDMWHALGNVNRLTWADAWELVVKEIRRVGSYSTPRFDDELTAKCVQAMGWKALCASENPQTDRAQFRDMYNALAARQEGAQKLLPQARELAGRLSANGHAGPVALGKLLEVKAQ